MFLAKGVQPIQELLGLDVYKRQAYTLRLYREDGTLLLGQSGTVRES